MIQVQNLPAAQVEDIRSRLNAQWKIEADALSKTYFKDIRQGKAKLAQLNAKYKQQELEALTKLQDQVREQQRVQSLIRKGTQGISHEEEAALRMQLGPEAERLVFPKPIKQPSYTPLSVATLRAREPGTEITKIQASIEDFAGEARTKSRFVVGHPARLWNPEKTRESLGEQYFKWRKYIGYDQLNPVQQQQYDNEWDAWMAGDDKYNSWWKDKEKAIPNVGIQIARGRGPISQQMKGKALGKQFTSPIGTAIQKAKSTGSRVAQPGQKLDEETARWILKQVGGNKNKARQKARELGYSF